MVIASHSEELIVAPVPSDQSIVRPNQDADSRIKSKTPDIAAGDETSRGRASMLAAPNAVKHNPITA
jgi:hypothetical protein